MNCNSPRHAELQYGDTTRRIGDQLYLHLWTEDELEFWGALCADCGVHPLIGSRAKGDREFKVARRCTTHSAPGIKVRSVFRVVDDETTLKVLRLAKAKQLGASIEERAQRFISSASALLREEIGTGLASPPLVALGSGWCWPFAGGVVQFCDICGKVSVVLNDPRKKPGWPLVRDMNCRSANRRSPTTFAMSLTASTKSSICRAAQLAVEQEESRWGGPMTDAQRREAFTRHAALALRILRVRHKEEHRQ